MIRFDIFSGFLGAGKTTLIRQILKSLRDEKVAIIENEYGDISIDSEVLSVAGFQVYELSNGCVCCTLKEDFQLTLREILKQKVDRIIFEPSGIFVLGEIFELFKDLQISQRCCINSVTTVVDALNFFKHVNSYSGLFINQIERATSLVVSKSQFIDDEEVRKIAEELRRINPSASIITKNWEGLTHQDILIVLNKSPEPFFHPIPSLSGHDFESLGLRTSRMFELEQLKYILETCKNGVYGHILRGKGIIPAGNTLLKFNYVDGQYDITELTEGSSGAVSFIGTNLKTEELKAIFQ
ncbi:CobW family GTP-binding protein [Paradesulfitobacterium ferrireducens]|uniref:CobW family GTP-binding protein n=1 Tax=Paradesulfitobacterium ferrireducens TaxID=2816476 RepID=UPI001A907C5E|nr:CobW family GTP-binding protein [Paradesulfitobacterium ferrireducens]